MNLLLVVALLGFYSGSLSTSMPGDPAYTNVIVQGSQTTVCEGDTAVKDAILQEEQQDLPQDLAALIVRQFYVEYISEWIRMGGPNTEKREAIQRQYITQQLFDRLQHMYNEMELDYDPFLEAQDCDKSVLEKLRIEKDTAQANVFSVYLWDGFNQKYKEVRLLLSHGEQGYKIDDILSLSKFYTSSD